MGLHRCHYKPGAIKTPARTTNGPALNNTIGQVMPTGAHGPERKKKKRKEKKKKKKTNSPIPSTLIDWLIKQLMLCFTYTAIPPPRLPCLSKLNKL